jgi:hypothetical protein
MKLDCLVGSFVGLLHLSHHDRLHALYRGHHLHEIYVLRDPCCTRRDILIAKSSCVENLESEMMK